MSISNFVIVLILLSLLRHTRGLQQRTRITNTILRDPFSQVEIHIQLLVFSPSPRHLVPSSLHCFLILVWFILEDTNFFALSWWLAGLVVGSRSDGVRTFDMPSDFHIRSL